MIGIAAWGKWFGLVSSFQVVGGVIGVGVFLFFVALAGLIGAMKHHQVLLFFVSFRRARPPETPPPISPGQALKTGGLSDIFAHMFLA